MGALLNMVKALFVAFFATETPVLALPAPAATDTPETPAPAPAPLWRWDGGVAAREEETLSLHLGGHTEAAVGQAASGRSKLPLAGGAIYGRDAKSAAFLQGYALAVGGDTQAEVYGVGLVGATRFGVVGNLSDQAYAGLVAACARARKEHGTFQVVVRCVRTAYTERSAKYNPALAGELQKLEYHGITEYRAPIRVLGLEVITPGHPAWVVPEAVGLDNEGVVTSRATSRVVDKAAHAAKVAAIKDAILSSSLAGITPPVPAVPVKDRSKDLSAPATPAEGDDVLTI